MISDIIDKIYQEPVIEQKKIVDRFSKSLRARRNVIERSLLVVSLIVICIQFQVINLYHSERISFVGPKPDETISDEKQAGLSCKLPKLVPFHPSIYEHLKGNLEIPNCSTNLLFAVDYNSTLLVLKNLEEAGFRECFYCRLVRVPENDDKIKITSNCVKITEPSTPIKTGFEFIAVKCRKFKSKHKHLIDIFAVVRVKPHVQARNVQIDKLQEKLNNFNEGFKDPKLNVIVLGIDSVSRMAFLRHMKNTSDYMINKLNAIGMNGYMKHGDNTFENIASVLTGKSITDLRYSCWTKADKYFDDCPFIWKLFSKNGYITSYLEDDPQLAAFNSVRKGFKDPPVDYYLRPANLALFNNLGHTIFGGPTACLGPRLAFDISLDYLKKVVHTANKDKYFIFSWTDTLTHDFLQSSSLVDDKVAGTLRWLNEGKYLNNTVFILMSDHGLRHGPYTNTYSGSIEIRMPMLYFVIPKWFQNKYGKAMMNLKENSDRLTNHFDLHETLLDFLYPSNITGRNLESRTEILNTQEKNGIADRGISLFLPIPVNRTCKDAGIGGNDCLCKEMREFDINNPEAIDAAESLVKSINRRLNNFPQCSRVKLLKIFSADTPDNGFIETLRITMLTSPGGMTFQGTVVRIDREAAEKSEWKLSGVIARTSIYRNQSKCIGLKDTSLKPYCYCQSINHHSVVDTF